MRILLITGSTRAGSTNTAALLTAQAVAPESVKTVFYDRLAELPAFNPDDDFDPLPAVVTEMRAEIEAADGVLFCTPEYAGALPGSFKNLLDWTVGGGEMDGKPVAWINVAGEGRGANAEASLRTVLGYLGTAVIEDASVRLTVSRDAVGADGLITDSGVRARMAEVMAVFERGIRDVVM